MDATTAAQPTRLHIRTALYAHRIIILLCAITGVLAGAAASGILPVSYSATASVLVQPLDGNPYAPNAQGSDLTNLETEAQVVASDVIANSVKAALAKAKVPPSARKGLKIGVAPNTQIVQVTYNGQSSNVVEKTALQYATSYLEFRKARRDAFIKSKQGSTNERIVALSEELKKLEKDPKLVDGAGARSIGAQLTNLRLQLAGLDTADSNPGEVITTPHASRSGLSLPWQLGSLIGLFLGLIVGAIIALLTERRAEVLRTVDDIEHLGVPVLGSHQGPYGDDLPAPDPDEDTPYDVAYLAGTILSRQAIPPTTVAVSNLSGGGAVTMFVNDLANVLSQGRGGVLLIDTASDVPTKAPGFSEVLSGTSQLKSALVKRVRGTPVDPVARMLVGKNPTKGAGLYSTSRMSEALEAAALEYNWVLLESPSSDLTAGRAVVGACHYWIPIVELGVCTRDDLERSLTWARATGVETLGVVVVQAPLTIFGRARRREFEPVSSD